MPRPHPPRKRPRRRPPVNQRAARADAALTKQTADSAQPKTAASRPSPAAQAAPVAAVVSPDQMWSRRSYAILMATVFGVQIVIGILLFALAQGKKDALDLAANAFGYQPFQPVPQLAACMLAAPVARRIAGELRPLRIVETLMAGVIIYALFFVLAIPGGFVLSTVAPVATSSSSCGGTTGLPTPLPLSSEPTPTPSRAGASATPCPSPGPSAAPRSSGQATPSPQAGVSSAAVAQAKSLDVLAIGVVDVLAYVLAVYIYPPVYQRFRYKPPPPRDKPSATGRGK